MKVDGRSAARLSPVRCWTGFQSCLITAVLRGKKRTTLSESQTVTNGTRPTMGRVWQFGRGAILSHSDLPSSVNSAAWPCSTQVLHRITRRIKQSCKVLPRKGEKAHPSNCIVSVGLSNLPLRPSGQARLRKITVGLFFSLPKQERDNGKCPSTKTCFFSLEKQLETNFA